MTRSSIKEWMRRSVARFIQKWEAVQVELHGFYSVERFRAMNEYNGTTSFWWALAVLLFTPLPSLAVVAMVDVMPMESVEKGFTHSGVAWARATIACFIYTHCAIEQIRHYTPSLNMGPYAGLYISIPASILTNALAFGLSAFICWPLPFATILMSGPWLGFIIFFLLKMRGAHMRANREVMEHVLQFAAVSGTQVGTMLIFAGYNSVFIKMSPAYQPVFALLIPGFKVLQKNIISRILAGRDDTKPQIVTLNVEIFNALFIATCMENSQTIGTSITLIVVDLLQAAISLLDLYRMINDVKAALDKLGVSSNALISTAELALKKYPAPGTDPLSAKVRSSHTWFAKRLARVSSTKIKVLPIMRLEPSGWDMPATSSSLSPPNASCASISSFTQWTSTVKFADVSFPEPTTGLNRLSRREHYRILKKALQVLFLTEFLLLIEFTEVLVPIIYGGYLIVLYYLPNRQYYPQLANLTDQKLWSMVSSVLGYGLMELGSLVILVCVLNRVVHRSSLQQLAFVLEREFFMVQPKLILWVTMTMQSTLPQMGVDYSFEFAWIHQSSNSTDTQ